MIEKGQEPTATLDIEQMAAYLSQHLELFVERDELIPELRIPHQPDDAVSLIRHQVRLLRERSIKMRRRPSQLMDVIRESNRLFDRTHHLVLDLLDTTSLEGVISTVEDNLRHESRVSHVSLILFSDSSVSVGCSVSSAEAHQTIGGLLSGGETVCGVLCPHGLASLFGRSDRDEIGSAAVVSLSLQGLYGVLAIGSPDPQHCKSPLGALFLGYAAEVLARVLPRFSSSLRSVR